MGGSSIWLARELSCNVRGVTLSPFQSKWASASALIKRVKPRPKFECADAEKLEIAAGSQDVVWSVECTEHLFDKPAFFERAAQWLRPGGKIAICAWLAGKNDDDQRPLIK